MNSKLKILSVFFIALMLSGCVSQNGQSFGDNFDRLKAAKTRVSLGLTYLNNGDFSQAKFNLDKALEFAPRSADANFAMAYYYQSVSELEQAEKAYQFAMDLEPKNANIANSYGAFLCQNGDYEKAKKYFLKAVNTSSYISSAETYENLALCSRSQGRPEDAIQYLRSAVNHQPGRANSLFLLARSLVETQQWKEARAILRRYEKTSQISPQSLLMAMKIERGTGNEAAAKGYSDMLLKIFPNDPLTKSFLTDQQPSPKLVNKTVKPVVIIKQAKTTSKLVESQANKKLSGNTLAQPEKNDSLATANNADINTALIAQSNESAPIKLAERATQVESEILDTVTESAKAFSKLAESQPNKKLSENIVTQAEQNDSFTNVKDDNIQMDDIDQTASVLAGQLTDEVSQVESEILDIPEFHIVAQGENLYRISLLYNIKMQRLIDWNGLVDSSAIFDGKKLSLVAPSVVE